MNRIIIIGCGGSGKSTLAVKLGKLLDIPVVHLDKLWWRPGWEHISREEFTELLARELEKPQWIMDGNFNHTLPERLRHCDTVIWLEYSRLACLWGVCKRILTTYGSVRPDMGEGCPERLDWEFLKWVWTFNDKHAKENRRLLETATHAKIHIFKKRRQLNKFLRELENEPCR